MVVGVTIDIATVVAGEIDDMESADTGKGVAMIDVGDPTSGEISANTGIMTVREVAEKAVEGMKPVGRIHRIEDMVIPAPTKCRDRIVICIGRRR